eukprot:3898272-Pyramimonas_sp.AAC.1
MALMLDMLLSPRMAGRFSPEPSATFAEYAPSLGTAGCPAGSPHFLACNLAAHGYITHRGAMSRS